TSDRYVWADDSVSGTTYQFDRQEFAVREFKPLTWEGRREDTLLGRTFDFSPFRQYVYDYGQIFQLVKEEVEVAGAPPDLVYVADLPTLPIGYMLKETVNCTLVVDCHEWWKEQAALFAGRNTNLIKSSDDYERFLYPMCDHRITVGRGLARA